MPTSKKPPTREGSEGEGAKTATAFPEGFAPGKNKYFADSVARCFDMLPPKGGVVRILLVAAKDAGPDEVREVFRSPRFALKMKAPGVFEATVKSDDMERVVAPAVGSGRTFRWVDLASRFYGLAARDPAEQATVAVSYEGTPEEAKKRLKALGMRIVVPKPPEGADAEEDWVDPDAGLIVGTIAASKLSDLVLLKEAASVHVRAIERPASK